MLETEEVEDDFFTPVAGTSLANIFGSSSNKEGAQNDSLKYIPPKPQNIVPKKKEPIKHSECMYACTVIGHEWYNNVYTARSSIGFAIVKIIKTGDNNIILYDSNKTTLSCVTISPKLEVTIKSNTYISYYDNHLKYWSIYTSEDQIKKVSEMLKGWGANINYSDSDKGPPEPKTAIETKMTTDDNEQQNQESDTDSSLNKKTKASILNRMANMGHSVLPTRTPHAELSSDSSDTIESLIKTARHKPVKTSAKKTSVENIVLESQNLTEDQQKMMTATTPSDKHVALYNSQLIPLASTTVMANTSSEFGMYMSEQRVNNSEIRININRITDKMDLVLQKINNLEPKEKDKNVSTDIMLKLITEYENKIKIYEEMLKSRNKDTVDTSDTTKYSCNEVELFKNKISELEKDNLKKSNEVSNLQDEIKLLKNNHSEESQDQVSKINELLIKLNSLEDKLMAKSKELTDLKTPKDTKVNNDSIEEKVKNIMNDTFQTISMNFDNNENYSGETIKRIIGTVIKKITIQTLSEL